MGSAGPARSMGNGTADVVVRAKVPAVVTTALLAIIATYDCWMASQCRACLSSELRPRDGLAGDR
jgi:hypothetical protein